MKPLSQDKWKYATFGLLAVLAIGFSFPQAYAHITTKTAHMLEHIYNMVSTLPEDPASITAVNTRASQQSVDNLQTSVNGIDATVTEIEDIVGGLGSGGGQINDAAILVAIHCGQFMATPLFVPGCDLTNAFIQNKDLNNAYMAGVILTQANFHSSDLSGAVLGTANLNQVVFSFADLSGASMDNVDLSGASLNEADFSGAVLIGSDLSDVFALNVNLQDAVLLDADLTNAYMVGANLDNADFNKTDLTGADFTDCTGTPVGVPDVGTLPTCS